MQRKKWSHLALGHWWLLEGAYRALVALSLDPAVQTPPTNKDYSSLDVVASNGFHIRSPKNASSDHLRAARMGIEIGTPPLVGGCAGSLRIPHSVQTNCELYVDAHALPTAYSSPLLCSCVIHGRSALPSVWWRNL